MELLSTDGLNAAIKENLSLARMLDILKRQQKQKIDTVVTPSKLRYRIENGTPILVYESPTYGELGLVPADRFHRNVCEKLGIPRKYYEKMLRESPRLLAVSVNTWLRSSDTPYMVRAFAPGRDMPSDSRRGGTARAMLSDHFSPSMDNLNVLTGTLEAIKGLIQAKELGQIQFEECNLTAEKMILKITAPEIVSQSRELLKNYRRPDGKDVHGDDQFGVQCGLFIGNSEVGAAAFKLTPMMMVSACRNKTLFLEKGISRRHTGSKLTDGVDYQADTLLAQRDWVQKETRDVVKTFLHKDWLDGQVRSIEAMNKPLSHPLGAVRNVAAKLEYSEAITDQLCDFFVQGGDNTAFGISQAITWQAQHGGRVSKDGSLTPFSVDEQLEMERAKNNMFFMPQIEKYDLPRQRA